MATRARLGQDFWERHLRLWRKSGQTQTLYCVSSGLNSKTFNRWKLRLANAKRQVASASPIGDKPISLIPVRVTESSSAGKELRLAGEIRIRLDRSQWVVDVPCGVDPKHLAIVLQAIAGVAQ